MTKVRVGQLAYIRNLPVGTSVIWPDGFESVETDGVVECEADYASELRFTLRHPKHLEREVVIHVTA